MMTGLLLGMSTSLSLLSPLYFRGWFRGVVQVVADDGLLGYQSYLVRFAPVAPSSSSAAG